MLSRIYDVSLILIYYCCMNRFILCLGNGWIKLIDICAITFLSIYGSILQMTWTLFEGVHLHLLLSLSYLPKHNYYLTALIAVGWGYPLLLIIGQLIHVCEKIAKL